MLPCDFCIVNFVCYSVPGTFSVFFDRKTLACVIKGDMCRVKKENRLALLTVYNITLGSSNGEMNCWMREVCQVLNR